MEHLEPLDDSQLREIDPSTSFDVRPGSTILGAWEKENTPFVLIYYSWENSYQEIIHRCDINIQKDVLPLNDEFQSELIRSFLLVRLRLIIDGAHEVRDPTNIWPIISLGFGPTERNEKGCRIISYISIAEDGSFFQAVTGEQNIYACEK